METHIALQHATTEVRLPDAYHAKAGDRVVVEFKDAGQVVRRMTFVCRRYHDEGEPRQFWAQLGG